MKSERRNGMVITGWAMTLGGLCVVLYWTIWEAATNFAQSPIATIVGLVIVLAVLTLLVPLPLFLAMRRAARSTQR
jgi:hypothetical protein